jgi:hypothetical protein
MKTIFNLVLFLCIIIALIFICNNLLETDVLNNKEEFSNSKLKINYKNEFKSKDIPKGNPTISFDYETVLENDTAFNLSDNYYNELKSGAQVHPQYEPQKGEEGKEFYKNKFSDQKVIYDNRMYEKPIHRYRTLENNDKELPKKISEIFDDSITDFKSLVPLKNGTLGDSIINGGFNLSSYGPDFINYENEKSENGGLIEKLNFSGYDPLIQSDSAIF